MYKSNNPYLSVIYSDGELLTLLKNNLLRLEDYLGKDSIEVPENELRELLLNTKLIISALKENGYSKQFYYL